MESLSEDQVKEFRTAFALFDRDGDGHISTKDFRTATHALGIHPSEAEFQDMINEVDMQGNGTICFVDFLNLMAQRMHETESMEQIKEAMKVFDRDGHGQISTHHFRLIMKQMGKEITDEVIADMVAEADPHQRGVVNYQEFMDKVQFN